MHSFAICDDWMLELEMNCAYFYVLRDTSPTNETISRNITLPAKNWSLIWVFNIVRIVSNTIKDQSSTFVLAM